eukprot:TRINITY_DN510_c1_g1_i2.p1 TRINITY_DN510_c1_g1~~TRINITY_DN510_c1_g1_i2.p1  ORF type:complete len:497 (+),score=155.81 TRINITY_DN510_c1_g1_i2:66-1556(+)
MREVEWGWDFTLQMDLWKARQHRFLADMTLVLRGERYSAHRLLLSIRSLPLAQLIEREGAAVRADAVVNIDSLFTDLPQEIDANIHIAFNAVLEFISTDWLMDVPLRETLLVCELSKVLQMPFLFSLAASRLLHYVGDEPAAWPLVVNALWVPAETDFARMLLDHTVEENNPAAAAAAAPPALPLPFDRCVSIARARPAAYLKSPFLKQLRLEALCAMLGDDFPECTLAAEHLEHLLLQVTVAWVTANPQHIQVLTLIKLPLLPAGALHAELKGTHLDVARELIEEGEKAPQPPLAPMLVSAAGGMAQAPGSVLWRLVERRTAKSVGEGGVVSAPASPTRPRGGSGGGPMGHHPHTASNASEDVSLQHLPNQDPSQQMRRVMFTPGDGPAAPPGAKPGGDRQGRSSDRGGERTSRASSRSDSASRQIVDRLPESILQNDGRPPVRYHQYRHLVCNNPSVNLSTMLWESSLRPPQTSSKHRSSSSSKRDSVRSDWRK